MSSAKSGSEISAVEKDAAAVGGAEATALATLVHVEFPAELTARTRKK